MHTYVRSIAWSAMITGSEICLGTPTTLLDTVTMATVWIVQVFVSTCTGKLRNSLGKCKLSMSCTVQNLEMSEHILTHSYVIFHLIIANIISSTPWSTDSHTVNYFQCLLYNLWPAIPKILLAGTKRSVTALMLYVSRVFHFSHSTHN